ncbi:MAG: hypothetical protein ABI876_11750 [Bacteroidota bacterium]
MGDDFANRQCFAGNGNRELVYERLLQTIFRSMAAAGYKHVHNEEDANRSIVIGPNGRWIFIGDTAGSTDSAAPDEFAALTADLSIILPVIEIHMCDSAGIHLKLYDAGGMIDKYGNSAFPFYKFVTDKEIDEFRGRPEYWTEYLLPGRSPEELRAIWTQDWRAEKILSDSAKLFGWDPFLCAIGYTLDVEGLGDKYDQVLLEENQSLEGFTELYFSI